MCMCVHFLKNAINRNFKSPRKQELIHIFSCGCSIHSVRSFLVYSAIECCQENNNIFCVLIAHLKLHISSYLLTNIVVRHALYIVSNSWRGGSVLTFPVCKSSSLTRYGMLNLLFKCFPACNATCFLISWVATAHPRLISTFSPKRKLAELDFVQWDREEN